jgi:DICT domain-containing protein
MKVWRLELRMDCEIKERDVLWEKFFSSNEKAITYAQKDALDAELEGEPLVFTALSTDALEAFSAFHYGSCYFLECFQVDE